MGAHFCINMIATAHLFWNNQEPEPLPNLLSTPHQVCLATPLALAQYYPHRIDCAPGVHILNTVVIHSPPWSPTVPCRLL